MRIRTIGLLVFFVFLATSAAFAGTVEIGSYIGTVGTIYTPWFSSGLGVYVGYLTVNGQVAYCVDLQHYDSGPGPRDATLGQMADWRIYQDANVIDKVDANLARANAGNYASWLYDTYAHAADVNQAALALAIWNVLYDTDLDVTKGSGALYFYVTGMDSTITTKANDYLVSMPTSAPTNNDIWVMTTDPNPANGNREQDYMMVPEPSSILLLGIAIFFVVCLARKFNS